MPAFTTMTTTTSQQVNIFATLSRYSKNMKSSLSTTVQRASLRASSVAARATSAASSRAQRQRKGFILATMLVVVAVATALFTILECSARRRRDYECAPIEEVVTSPLHDAQLDAKKKKIYLTSMAQSTAATNDSSLSLYEQHTSAANEDDEEDDENFSSDNEHHQQNGKSCYLCENSTLTIPNRFRCDGVTDCPQGDDEDPKICKAKPHYCVRKTICEELISGAMGVDTFLYHSTMSSGFIYLQIFSVLSEIRNYCPQHIFTDTEQLIKAHSCGSDFQQQPHGESHALRLPHAKSRHESCTYRVHTCADEPGGTRQMYYYVCWYLQHLPRFHPATRSIIIHNASLPQIGFTNETDKLSNFAELEYLYFSSSTFGEINPNALRGNIRLRAIKITKSSIDKLPAGLFQNLPSLQSIDLQENNLTSLPDGIFANLPALQKLTLSENNLTSLTYSMFFDDKSLQQNKTNRQLRSLKVALNNLIYFDSKLAEALAALEVLGLMNNSLTSIWSSPDHFHGLCAQGSKLKCAELQGNRLRNLPEDLFANCTRLGLIDLSDNLVEHVPAALFKNTTRLRTLNLAYNPIVTFDSNAIKHLKVYHLDLRGFLIPNITTDMFPPVAFEEIKFETFLYCDLIPTTLICHPSTDGISSRLKLIESDFLRAWIWVCCALTFGANLTVFFGRWTMRTHHSQKADAMFIKHLSAYDFLMSAYLFIIGLIDLTYNKEYFRHALQWRNSFSCSVIGVLVTVSSEGSVLTLAFMSVERAMCIASDMARLRLSYTTCMRGAALIATVVMGLALAPMLLFPPLDPLPSLSHHQLNGSNSFSSANREDKRDGGYYGANGLCLPLHIHEPLARGWQFSFLLICGINAIAVGTMCACYVIMFNSYRRSRSLRRFSTGILSESPKPPQQNNFLQQKESPALLLPRTNSNSISIGNNSSSGGNSGDNDNRYWMKFFLVIASDIACWLPIIIIKVLALAGYDISTTLYVWVAAVFLPINSCLNPLLYTLVTASFRQTVMGLVCTQRCRQQQRQMSQTLSNASLYNAAAVAGAAVVPQQQQEGGKMRNGFPSPSPPPSGTAAAAANGATKRTQAQTASSLRLTFSNNHVHFESLDESPLRRGNSSSRCSAVAAARKAKLAKKQQQQQQSCYQRRRQQQQNSTDKTQGGGGDSCQTSPSSTLLLRQQHHMAQPVLPWPRRLSSLLGRRRGRSASGPATTEIHLKIDPSTCGELLLPLLTFRQMQQHQQPTAAAADPNELAGSNSSLIVAPATTKLPVFFVGEQNDENKSTALPPHQLCENDEKVLPQSSQQQQQPLPKIFVIRSSSDDKVLS